MSSSSLKNELADHIYQYLCHEAQYSDLPEAARESLTAASECIEQAYRLNVNNNNINKQQQSDGGILPDELLRIFTRHKEFLSQQQKDSLKYLMRNENESSSIEKPDIRINSHQFSSNDSHNTSNPNSPASTNNSSSVHQQVTASLSGSSQQQQQQQTVTKQHTQHTISQLPMTTRKKLSHLRAQIKRQASKAARSRLEKRSSVSGGTSSGSGHGSFSGFMGTSLDVNIGTSNKQAGDGYNQKESVHQQSSASSIDSPRNLANTSTTSPAGQGGGGIGSVSNSGGSSAQNDPNFNSTSSAGQQNESTSGHNKEKNSHLIPGSHHHSIGVSVHQKNFKQKLIALIKKFRTDGSDFDSEEQYREALERELMKAAAGRGSRAIEELLEEDIDVEEESGSEGEDWDNISESSTPKPSLRPFFSSTTLDKI